MKRYTQKTSLVTLSDINITPLLDLAFVLLIIFMITTPLMEKGLQLRLPSGRASEELPSKSDLKVVEVDARGVPHLEGAPLDLDTLRESLRAAHEANPRMVLVVRGDQRAPWEHMFDVLDMARVLGVKNVSFLHEIPGAP